MASSRISYYFLNEEKVNLPTYTDLQKELRSARDPEKIQVFARFFKTGKGQYGEGDEFLGLTVPEQRIISKKYFHLGLTDVTELLHSPIHEERLISLFILIAQYEKASKEHDHKEQKIIANFYQTNAKRINNWDLVDTSADKIFGHYLFTLAPKSEWKSILTQFAQSENLWERRISIMSTFYTIKNGNPQPTIDIATILLHDKHDLIHKAVGWMLREIGKRCSREIEEEFLEKYSTQMPRTMLRYAIEHFPKEKQKYYLSRK